MERRDVEQWSDREVEVGVLIRKKQTPLSACPPDTHTHTHEDRRPPTAHTHTHHTKMHTHMLQPTHPKVPTPARDITSTNKHHTRIMVTPSSVTRES